MGVYGVIYKVENSINKKVYIGQTVNSFNKRYECEGFGAERLYRYHKTHKEFGYPYNKHLLSSMDKYGYENFKVDEVFDVAHSKDELNEKEIYWIKYFDSKNNGYNKTDGGEGGVKNEIICLNNGKIYDSISSIKNKYNCDSFSIFRPKVTSNTGKLYGKELIWMKKSDYDKYDCNGNIIYGKDELLENLADYILESNKVSGFKIYTRNSYTRTDETINKSLKRSYYDYYKNKNIKVIDEYNEFRMNIINSYQNKEIYECLKNKLNGKTRVFGLSEKLKKISKELKEDMEELEYILEDRKIKFNCDETINTQELNIDLLTDKDNIKSLLRLDKPDDFNDDLYAILMDLEYIVNKTDLTEKQKEAIYWHKTGLTVREIGEKLNISGSCVSRHIDDAIKKIIKTQRDTYEKDFLYLYKEKGNYRTCRKCGKTKLISEFNKDKNDKYVRRSCKECRKKQYIKSKGEK